MILTQNLGKRFGDFQAVDDVNLRVDAGEVLALLGPNGAGKTTTVRMLTSLLVPSSGWARVAEFDTVRQASQVRASVGVLTENHGLYNRMPAGAYLDFFGQIYSQSAAVRKQRIHQLLEDFGLIEHLRQPIGEFSKGMRQKLALARALLHNPPVLLLDEPTSAMDPESARLVRDSIRTLRSEERTIVICTHNLAEAEELSDQIAIIRRGKIIAQGSPPDLKARMLGPEEYEIRLAIHLNGRQPVLPGEVVPTSSGPDWIRYRTLDPAQANPLVLQALVTQGLPVVTLQTVPRSLEQVYMQAINAANPEEVPHVE
jgi:ABC-2 type transport system ATP-binding protein